MSEDISFSGKEGVQELRALRRLIQIDSELYKLGLSAGRLKKKADKLNQEKKNLRASLRPEIQEKLWGAGK